MALRRGSSSHDLCPAANDVLCLTGNSHAPNHLIRRATAWGDEINSRPDRTVDEAHIIPEQPNELPPVPSTAEWQHAVAAKIGLAHEQYREHEAQKTWTAPQSVHVGPLFGPNPPMEVLGSKELYMQWRQRVSPKHCTTLAMHPTRYATTLRGRPVCVWILSHLNAPIVEWDSYFAHVFAPLTPRVVYGVTSGCVEQKTEDMVSHLCVMQAWRVSAFVPPLRFGEGMPSP